MNNTSATVRVEHLHDPEVIKMSWDHRVSSDDVYSAFKAISVILEQSETELYVLVDILANPNFPFSATVNGAMFGPYRNPKLIAWLIVGSSHAGRMIERVLTAVTKRRNVEWFDSEADALAHMAQQGVDSETSEVKR